MNMYIMYIARDNCKQEDDENRKIGGVGEGP